jgi:TrmH family RNA methyltransferase
MYSYTSGAYATIMLLETKPEIVKTVYVHSGFKDKELIETLCVKAGVLCVQDDYVFRRVNQKENTFVLAVFDKYTSLLSPSRPHVVLINPGDMGNLGTIVRTIAAVNLPDLALIMPGADLWHPKTIRASMGSLFCIRFEMFGSFEEYRQKFAEHRVYPFMLDGELELSPDSCPREERFSLVFGNEAAGLKEDFRRYGQSIKLRQTQMVDSMNVSVAVGIGAYIFSSLNGLLNN